MSSLFMFYMCVCVYICICVLRIPQRRKYVYRPLKSVDNSTSHVGDKTLTAKHDKVVSSPDLIQRALRGHILQKDCKLNILNSWCRQAELLYYFCLYSSNSLFLSLKSNFLLNSRLGPIHFIKERVYPCLELNKYLMYTKGDAIAQRSSYK